MKKICMIGWFAAVVMLAACQNSVNTIENADKTMTPNYVNDSRFVTDGFLKRRLALQSLTGSFPGLDLAARKFPSVLVFSIATLYCEYSVAAAYHCCRYSDDLHHCASIS